MVHWIRLVPNDTTAQVTWDSCRKYDWHKTATKRLGLLAATNWMAKSVFSIFVVDDSQSQKVDEWDWSDGIVSTLKSLNNCVCNNRELLWALLACPPLIRWQWLVQHIVRCSPWVSHCCASWPHRILCHILPGPFFDNCLRPAISWIADHELAKDCSAFPCGWILSLPLFQWLGLYASLLRELDDHVVYDINIGVCAVLSWDLEDEHLDHLDMLYHDLDR